MDPCCHHAVIHREEHPEEATEFNKGLQTAHAHQFCSYDRDIRKISFVFIFISIFMMIELWGHFKTRSLSLLADALHLLVDISGFIVSIVTLKLSKRAPNNQMTFGYERTEVIGALFSIFFIWTAIIYLMAESVHKYLHPKEIDGKTFLTIAVVGLVVNVLCMLILHFQHGVHGGCAHGSPQQTLNMRATYIHVVGDIIQSFGVVVASAIIFFFPKAVIADVLCTLFFACLVFVSTYYIVKDAIRILSEGTPKGVQVDEIKRKVLSISKTIKVTDIKVWNISVNKRSLTIKVLIEDGNIKAYESTLLVLKAYLSKEMKFDFVNIQIDTPLTNQEDLTFRVLDVPLERAV